MGSVSVELRGADQLARTAHACADQLADLTEPNTEAADAYLDLVRPTIPRRSGRLAASARIGGVTPLGATIVVAAPYAVHVNKHRPFLVPVESPRLIEPYETHTARAVSLVNGT